MPAFLLSWSATEESGASSLTMEILPEETSTLAVAAHPTIGQTKSRLTAIVQLILLKDTSNLFLLGSKDTLCRCVMFSVFGPRSLFLSVAREGISLVAYGLLCLSDSPNKNFSPLTGPDVLPGGVTLFAVHHERDELGAARGVELLEYSVEVGFDRVFA
jgi:hypothetical protein